MLRHTTPAQKRQIRSVTALLRVGIFLSLMVVSWAFGGYNLASQPPETPTESPTLSPTLTLMPQLSATPLATPIATSTNTVSISVTPMSTPIVVPPVVMPMAPPIVGGIGGNSFLIIGEPAFLEPESFSVDPALSIVDVTGSPTYLFTFPTFEDAADELPFTPVLIYYATNRNDTGALTPEDKYGSRRSEEVSFGTCIVTVPDTHRQGEIERPERILFYEFSADPAQHILLNQVNSLAKEEFYRLLNEYMATPGEAFVFIHGFNNTFEDAALRTAQIAYDLGFAGVPIMYSWPSRGHEWDYPPDEQSMIASRRFIKEFLIEISALTNARTIHLIAHSLGNDGLAWALVDMAEELSDAQLDKINQIILAAPDIDAGVFKNEIVPKITQIGEQITLYASSADKPLLASKIIHDFPRAGNAGVDLVVTDGINTIDASNVRTDFLNHDYAFRPAMFDDLEAIINEHATPMQRSNLARRDNPGGFFWQFIVPDPAE